MNQNLIVLLLIFVFISCGIKDDINSRNISIYSNPEIELQINSDTFQMEYDLNPIDYELVYLSYKKSDVSFDFRIMIGETIGSFREKEPLIFQEKEVYERHKRLDDLERDFYYVSPKETVDMDLFLKQSIKIDSIGNSLVKIITPRNGRKGLYAVHFYSIYRYGYGGDLKLNIFGYDLNEAQEKELIRLAENIIVKD